MFFKVVIFAASCMLSASAVPVLAPSYAHGPGIAYAAPAYAAPAYAAPAYAAPAHYAPAVAAVAKVPIYPDSVPNYSFGYAVADPHTGDVKEQQETRHGDAVQGSYALNEPDGTRRVVHYTADDHNGFNAVVEHQGAPVKAVVAAPVVKAVAPAVYAAPAHYAAPAYAPAHYAAPAYAPAHYAAPAAVAVSHYAPHGGYHY